PRPRGGGGAWFFRRAEAVREPFSFAMSQSVLLPAFVALFGIIAAIFVVGYLPAGRPPGRPTRRKKKGKCAADDYDYGDFDGDFDGDFADDFDDDDYVEFILRRDPGVAPAA